MIRFILTFAVLSTTGGTMHWSQQSTIHIATFGSAQRTLPTSVTHLSICTTDQLTLDDLLVCNKIVLRPLHVALSPHYTSILSAHQHTHLPDEERAFLLSLSSPPQLCSFYYASFWMYTERRTLDYVRRCSLSRSNGTVESLSILAATATATARAPPATLHLLRHTTAPNTTTNTMAPANNPALDKTITPTIPTNTSTASPTKFGVQHIQSKPVRDVWMSFIQTNMKVQEMADAGVQAKELYAMVVDKIGNEMPEILTQLISSLIKIPLVTLIGQLLSALLPDALVPNSGATPNVPIVPGVKPIKPDPPPKCACSGGASFSLLEQWRKSKGIVSDGSAFVEEGNQCPCKNDNENDNDNDNNNNNNNNKVNERNEIINLIEINEEESEDETELSKHKERMRAQAEQDLKELDTAFAPGNGGGSNGGPIAKIEPKVRDDVMDGLKANCMPELQQKLAAKIIELFPTVKYSVYRGAVRGLSQSLTKSITNALVDALLKKLFMGLTRHTTRELTTRMTIGLTHALASTVTHSLSRSPKDDYYCHYCEEHSLYCNQCAAATTKEYELDYRISYYATYFSTYYSRFYGTTISDYIAKKPSPGHDSL